MNSTSCHLITSEYPPQAGGVSDYTRLVAEGLASCGEEVHVWGPATGDRSRASLRQAMSESLSDAGPIEASRGGLFIHRELGRFAPKDLRRAGKLLDQFKGPRRLLVQWVPHGYGYRSMNLHFCLWLWRRARLAGDEVELMVHEPYLAFGEGSWKQNGVAAVHRLMALMLLRAAGRVWVSVPHWEALLRPYAPGRALPFLWLPVSSNIAVVEDSESVKGVRARYAPAGGLLLGHFGTYERNVRAMLMRSLPALLRSRPDCAALLLGRGSEEAGRELKRLEPDLANRIHAAGELEAAQLSLHLSACDLMLQPFIDGVSSRRTSVMVGLAHSRPIITTRGRLTEDLWTSSEAVALAPVEDARALIETAGRLLADEEGRRRLGVAARSLYETRFDARLLIKRLREAVPSA